MPSSFAGVSGDRAHTVEWLTPPEIIAALGPFDLDPCAPLVQPFPTATRTFTLRDNGLIQIWKGRVWLNPPYTTRMIVQWLARMAAHDFGTALIFARTDTEAFQRYVLERATALLFMRGRVNFLQSNGLPALRRNGTPADAGAPTVLCAYGIKDADILAACKIEGRFVPLRIPRSIMVSLLESADGKAAMPWREVLAEFFATREGPVELAEIYRFARAHPRAATNRHPEAKVRQELQQGPYQPVQRGLWEASR